MAFNPLSYIKESRAELNNVIWPTQKTTIRLTIMVILVSLAVGLYVAGLDAAFTKMTEILLITK